eukprot:m.238954 g.238954  ORF g.238954 m.238954 type:complete len:68 (-) comp15812_c0_seq3:2773-2976(-)
MRLKAAPTQENDSFVHARVLQYVTLHRNRNQRQPSLINAKSTTTTQKPTPHGSEPGLPAPSAKGCGR